MPDKRAEQAEAQQNLKKLSLLIPCELQDRENKLVMYFSKEHGTVFDKLKLLYSFMEELSKYVNNVTPCKMGCCYCCHIPISISALELEYIRMVVPDLRGKMNRSETNPNDACPFLSEGSCSIYDTRPYVCRKHVVLTKTSYWCHPDRCNSTNVQMLDFSEVKKVYDLLLFESGALARRFDIRESSRALLVLNGICGGLY